MIDQLLAELRKMRTTRTNLGLLAGMVGLLLLTVLTTGLVSERAGLASLENQYALLSVGTSGAVFAALIGVMAITSEFRHGTIRPTFVVTPRRGRVLAAKVIASLMMGFAFGLLATALSFGIGYGILTGRDIHIVLDTNDMLLLILGSLWMTTLWAALGVGLGALIHNQVFAVVGLIIWLLVIDGIIGALGAGVARFTLGAVSSSITGDPASDLLPPLAGGALLLAYATALVTGGALVVARRDVT